MKFITENQSLTKLNKNELVFCLLVENIVQLTNPSNFIAQYKIPDRRVQLRKGRHKRQYLLKAFKLSC